MRNSEETREPESSPPPGGHERPRFLGLGGRWCDLRTARLKLIYFTLFAGVVVVWVQLGPYQKTLGLSDGDTGVMSVVGSCMIILGPLTAGVWADAMGDFRRLLAATALLNGVVAFSFTLVPPIQTPNVSSLNVSNTSVKLCRCFELNANDNTTQIFGRNAMNFQAVSAVAHETAGLEISGIDLLGTTEASDTPSNCHESRQNQTLILLLQDKTKVYANVNISFYEITEREMRAHDENINRDSSYEQNTRAGSLETEVRGREEPKSGREEQGGDRKEEGADVRDTSGRSFNAPECVSEEQIIVADKTNETNGDEGSSKAITFWSYLVLHASFMLLNSASISMFESAVLAQVSEREVDYGQQRCFGSIAATVSAPLGGALVDWTSSPDKGTSSYRATLYTSSCLMLLSSALLSRLDISFKRSAGPHLAGLTSVIVSNLPLAALLCEVFLGGIS
ncbi:uncharacterized protein LOC108666578 [Hyalella azteca]|uniref:Uncharacterized protein LOC108666578 n=1 Tax=Hyalella azteca TaxID=294128 RepID=A0A8B7N6Q9_HYAAZ|nr:uncharacterized protein LOC108666578 [Hyalella azteca]